jgi:hypothetical protein
MDQLAPVLEAFDKLDIVLAVFGALVVALWFGRGKTVGGILTGALMGGLVKPALFLLIGGGLLFAVQQPAPELKQTKEQQDQTIKFWSR